MEVLAWTLIALGALATAACAVHLSRHRRERRQEIESIVQRLAPEQRSALIGALTAFTEAGGEPAAPSADGGLYPLGWSDVTLPQGS